jgi:diguanylate cyclase (GGDEF)-like protein
MVDMAGFPSLEDHEPTLSDVTLRRTGRSVPEQAVSMTAQEASTGEHQAELIQIAGHLIGRSRVMTDSALLLSSGSSMFLVILPASSTVAAKGIWSGWKDGSDLLVTGVLSGKVDERKSTRREGISQLQSFQILVRSSTDIKVLRRPSWWTAEHTLVVLSLVLTMTLCALVWVVILRRRLEQQSLLIRRSEERFRHQAEHDSLTGLRSRAALLELFHLALEQAKGNGSPLALLMMDVDHFKQINDTLGHAAGDHVLCTVARRLQAGVRKSDTLARMGGDEFLCLLPGIADSRELANLAAELVSSIAVPIHLEGRDISVSISVGVSMYPAGGESAASLFHSGDLAMYKAKVLGRNGYQLFSPETASV